MENDIEIFFLPLRDSSVAAVTGHGTDDCGSILRKCRVITPRPLLGFTHPPTQLAQGVISSGVKWQEHTLTIHLQMPLLRMRGALSPPSYMPKAKIDNALFTSHVYIN